MLLLAATALAQQFGDSGRGVTKTCGTHCQGTSYPNTLKGTNGKNHIKGLGGYESATFGDLIQGFGDNDVLHGDAGGDRIEGGSGKDLIFSDRGKDVLIGGIGNDHIDGGTGGDIIRVRDGYRDIVNCEGAATTSPTAIRSTCYRTARASHRSKTACSAAYRS